jgi:YbbR domain-containing protein
MLNGTPYADPDTLEVTGPSFIIDTLTSIETEPLKLRNLSDTAERKVQLKKINRTTVNLKKIRVIIPVDEFTESEYTVPIRLENVPDTVSLKTFPKTVRIKYQVTLHNFEKVHEDMFRAWIDYETIDPELTTKLLVRRDSLPPYIQNVSVIPRTVEYLIEK